MKTDTIFYRARQRLTIEDLSNALISWCSQQKHSAQLDALRNLLQPLSSATVEFLLGTNPDTVQSPSYPLSKSALQNAVER